MESAAPGSLSPYLVALAQHATGGAQGSAGSQYPSAPPTPGAQPATSAPQSPATAAIEALRAVQTHHPNLSAAVDGWISHLSQVATTGASAFPSMMPPHDQNGSPLTPASIS